jgi:hypothetical protein
MAVISGFHVDDYCIPTFLDAVQALRERLGAEKVTDFLSIVPGDLVARVPPKITSEGTSKRLRPIPVYEISAVGDDFDESGNLVRGEESGHLYFESSVCYLLDLNSEEPCFKDSGESVEGTISCFDAREVGLLKEKHQHLPEELRGILYRIPAERVAAP